MSQSAKAPRPRFARPGANPTLATLEYIRGALRSADGPMSRNALLLRLAAWGHSTTRQSLNAALGFLAEDGTVAEGSKGLIWVPVASSRVREALRRRERL